MLDRLGRIGNISAAVAAVCCSVVCSSVFLLLAVVVVAVLLLRRAVVISGPRYVCCQSRVSRRDCSSFSGSITRVQTGIISVIAAGGK